MHFARLGNPEDSTGGQASGGRDARDAPFELH